MNKETQCKFMLHNLSTYFKNKKTNGIEKTYSCIVINHVIWHEIIKSNQVDLGHNKQQKKWNSA
jgi:hypothetical protein